jgi:crossover junction endodeoxyribonuclease RusA
VTALAVTVLGVPVPQGAIRSLGTGRPSVHANAKSLHPWRQMVAQQVRWQMGDAGLHEPLEGPMVLTATFVMPRPKSAPKSRWAPDRRPDLSHLVRALEDAIVMGGGVVDDSQFVTEHVSKTYPAGGAVPGVTFSIAPAVRGEQVAA